MTTLIGSGKNEAFTAASVDTSTISISGSRKYLRALVLVGDGTTQDLPTSVVWDPAGANESLTLVQDSGVFNSFWRAAVYQKIAPTDGAAKPVRATWAAAREEILAICAAWTDVDQTTPTRSLPSPATGTTASPSLAVSTVSGDEVTGWFAFGTPNQDSTSRFTSSLMTLRQVIDGTTNMNELLAFGDVTATGTSTNVGGSITNGNGAYVWYLFGAALISDTGGGGATYSRRKKRTTPSQAAPFNPQQFTRRRGSTANPVVTRNAIASLDLAVQLARQSTASFDTAVQAPRSATAAIDLATQAARNMTAALDTAVQIASGLTASLQAAVQTSPAASASLDMAVQAARNATANLDAALQVARAATASIDLSVQAPTSATASLDLQVQAGTSLAAALQLAVLATANAGSAVDLAVQRPLNATAALGLAVQQALSAAATLDIAMQAARSAGASIDLQVQLGTSVAAALSAAVQASAAAQTQLGLAVQDAHAVTAAIDLALALQRNSTAAFDAAITRAQSASAGVSLYVLAEQLLVAGERGYAVRDVQPARPPQRTRGARSNRPAGRRMN